MAEIALAVVLLWSSGLVVRSFGKLAEVQPGFESDDVLTAWISVEETSHSTDRQVASYFDRLLSSLSRLPGVETVGLTSLFPLSGDDEDFDFGIEGKAPPPPALIPIQKHASWEEPTSKASPFLSYEGVSFPRQTRSMPREL